MMTLDVQDSGKLFVTPRMALFTLTLFYTGLNQANSLFFYLYLSSLSNYEMFEPGHLGRGSHIIYWLHKNVRYQHLHCSGHQGIILHIIHQCLHLHAHRCQHLSINYVLKRGKQYRTVFRLKSLIQKLSF